MFHNQMNTGSAIEEWDKIGQIGTNWES